MRRLLPLLFLACAAKHPPEDAHVMARPGEPCFEHPKPWEDPVGPPIQNTQNLPPCTSELRNVDLTNAPLIEGGLSLPFPIFVGADAGRDGPT